MNLGDHRRSSDAVDAATLAEYLAEVRAIVREHRKLHPTPLVGRACVACVMWPDVERRLAELVAVSSAELGSSLAGATQGGLW